MFYQTTVISFFFFFLKMFIPSRENENVSSMCRCTVVHAGISIPWGESRYVIQPSQHRGPGMPGGLGSSQIGYREQKFSFQLRKKISYYYFHLGNHWVDAMLVLGKKRSRFTRREMPVIFPTPCQRLMYVQEPAPNIFFYTSEKKNSRAENEYILMSSSFGMSFLWCPPIPLCVRLFLSTPHSTLYPTHAM